MKGGRRSVLREVYIEVNPQYAQRTGQTKESVPMPIYAGLFGSAKCPHANIQGPFWQCNVSPCPYMRAFLAAQSVPMPTCRGLFGSAKCPHAGGGGGDMQDLSMRVLTEFFSPLEKRGSLAGICTVQSCPPNKGTVFVWNKNQGKKAPRDPHWNL